MFNYNCLTERICSQLLNGSSIAKPPMDSTMTDCLSLVETIGEGFVVCLKNSKNEAAIIINNDLDFISAMHS